MMSLAGKLTFEALKKVVQTRMSTRGLENVLLKEMRLLSGADGSCKCEIQVSESMLNARGTMHGGVSAILVDAVSTYALMTTGTGTPGVSLDLNISYLKPVSLHDMITVQAQTLSIGKTVAVATVDITKTESGQLVAHGRHTKYVGIPKASSS